MMEKRVCRPGMSRHQKPGRKQPMRRMDFVCSRAANQLGTCARSVCMPGPSLFGDPHMHLLCTESVQLLPSINISSRASHLWSASAGRAGCTSCSGWTNGPGNMQASSRVCGGHHVAASQLCWAVAPRGPLDRTQPPQAGFQTPTQWLVSAAAGHAAQVCVSSLLHLLLSRMQQPPTQAPSPPPPPLTHPRLKGLVYYN